MLSAKHPIPQMISYHPLPPPFLLKIVHSLFHGFCKLNAVEKIGVYHHSTRLNHLVRPGNFTSFPIWACHHPGDGQVIFFGKLKISFIVTRTTLDRPRPHMRQNKI